MTRTFSSVTTVGVNAIACSRTSSTFVTGTDVVTTTTYARAGLAAVVTTAATSEAIRAFMTSVGPRVAGGGSAPLGTVRDRPRVSATELVGGHNPHDVPLRVENGHGRNGFVVRRNSNSVREVPHMSCLG